MHELKLKTWILCTGAHQYCAGAALPQRTRCSASLLLLTPMTRLATSRSPWLKIPAEGDPGWLPTTPQGLVGGETAGLASSVKEAFYREYGVRRPHFSR